MMVFGTLFRNVVSPEQHDMIRTMLSNANTILNARPPAVAIPGPAKPAGMNPAALPGLPTPSAQSNPVSCF